MTVRSDRIRDEYTNQRSTGSATKANIYNWVRRASANSTPHSMHDGGGCCSGERDLDPPKVPSTGRVKNFKT
jgi:hypothetical protein